MTRFLPLLVFALLAACTAIKLSYNKLDWFVNWQVSKYVDLGAPQQALLERGVESLWRWHRKTQLELYARDLRELAGRTKPLTPAQVEDYRRRGEQHMERATREAVPELAKVIRAMSDAQLTEMLDSLAAKREERAKEMANLSLKKQQQRASDKMLKNTRRWLGSVSGAQKKRIEAWAASRRYDPKAWEAYQQNWTGSFEKALAARRTPGFEQQLSKLFLEPGERGDQAINAIQQHNLKRWVQLMSELSGTLDAPQRAHFQQQLRELIADLEELAAQAA